MITFEYDFDLKFIDWMSIIFRRNKTCPTCDEKVKRVTRKLDLGGGMEWRRSGLKFNYGHVEKRMLEIRYVCSNCNQRYMPSAFW